jgi:hypothetical protein
LLGPRDWKPLNKARYIARLRDSSPEILTWEDIQEIVGSNANLLKNYYAAYKVYEKSFEPVVKENGGDINDDEIMAGKFSSLAEYVKMPHLLVDDYGDDADKQFCEWLYHGKKWARNAEVRKLKEIFADDEKKKAFLEEDGTVTKAIQINPGTPIEPDLAELCDEVFEKIHVIGPTDWEELKDEDQRTAEAMTHLHSELDKIINN